MPKDLMQLLTTTLTLSGWWLAFLVKKYRRICDGERPSKS